MNRESESQFYFQAQTPRKVHLESGAWQEDWEVIPEKPSDMTETPTEEPVRFSDWLLEPYFDQPGDTLSGRWYGKLAPFGL